MVTPKNSQKEISQYLRREAIERLNADIGAAQILDNSEQPEQRNSRSFWLRYLVAGLFVLLALVGVAKANLGPLGSLVTIAIAWWIGLAAIASYPAFEYFEAEKKWIARCNCEHALFGKYLYLTYWPIYVPKPAYLFIYVLAAILSFVIKHKSN